MNQKTKRVALFGGSFNPPHRGHAAVVRHLCERRDAERPAFDEVWLVPCFRHPFAKDLADFSARFHLCELLLQDLGLEATRARVSDIEKRLGGESRTIHTLESLHLEFPGVQWTFALGEDLRAEVPQWKDAERLPTLAAFYFFPRQGFSPQAFAPEVSSTEIRRALEQGGSLDALVTPGVAAYLKQHGLKPGVKP